MGLPLFVVVVVIGRQIDDHRLANGAGYTGGYGEVTGYLYQYGREGQRRADDGGACGGQRKTDVS